MCGDCCQLWNVAMGSSLPSFSVLSATMLCRDLLAPASCASHPHRGLLVPGCARLGRSNVRMKRCPGVFERAGQVGACCARGRALSGGAAVIHPFSISLAYFTAFAGGYRRSQECPMYARRISHESPGRPASVRLTDPCPAVWMDSEGAKTRRRSGYARRSLMPRMEPYHALPPPIVLLAGRN